jgi:hypothetical protein
MASVPKGGAVWLGPGAFTYHEDRFETQREARRLFLEAIRGEVPNVLDHLAGEPLTLFRPLWERAVGSLSEEQARAWYLHIDWNWNRFKYADHAQDPDAATLRERLTHWAQWWNLDSSDDDWLMDRVVETLQSWCAFPGPLERNGPAWANDPRSTTFELSRAEQEITLPAYTWNPQGEREPIARQRIRDDFERRLAAEFDRINSIAAKRLARTRKLGSGDARFRWLVFYQVLKLNWVQVAKRAEIADRDYVRDEAHAIAAVIGITPREPKVGAPPKHRSRVVRRKTRAIATENQG